MTTPTEIAWQTPLISDLYTEVIDSIKFRLENLAKGLDVTNITGVPTGAIQWQGSSNKWRKWNGTAWTDLSTTYGINVATAAALQTGRTIAITGDISYITPSFTGSSNVTAAATLATVNASVGTYGSTTVVPIITVNAKGLITNVSSATLSGMATQSASAVSITGGTLSGITSLNIPSGSGSTAEGIVQWDVSADRLTIGTGSTTKTFVDTDSTQTLTGKSFSTQIAGNSSTLPATTEFVTTANNLKANLSSPTFSGVPTAPTPGSLDNSTRIATTAYVNNNALMLQGELGANINLDTRTTTGIFNQSTNANATILLNYPVASAGKLEVYANGSMIYQYYHQHNTTDIYVRAKFATGAFTTWGKLAKTTDTVAASSVTSNFLGGSANRILVQSGTNITDLLPTPTVVNTSPIWLNNTITWGNPLASGIMGGSANRIAFQSAANTTSFVDAPTVANTALVWNGTTLTWGNSGATVANDTMYENSQIISSSYTITFGKSAMSVGPITINSGVTVTVPNSSRWVVL